MTAVKSCTCLHEFQDKTYGTGKRLFNQCASKSEIKEYRCTVCNTKKK